MMMVMMMMMMATTRNIIATQQCRYGGDRHVAMCISLGEILRLQAIRFARNRRGEHMPGHAAVLRKAVAWVVFGMVRGSPVLVFVTSVKSRG